MDEPDDDLEPLFDYSRVQPLDFVCLDDEEDWGLSPICSTSKRLKKSTQMHEKREKSCKVVDADEDEGGGRGNEEEDWLPPPPPKVPKSGSGIVEDKTLQELRLQKQELASLAHSADDVLRAVMESAKREVHNSSKSLVVLDSDQPLKPQVERQKIVISIQDKDGHRQYKVFIDDNFERLFKMYAERAKLKVESLVFSFDGEKISPQATPLSLGMENDDMIEAHMKESASHFVDQGGQQSSQGTLMQMR